MQHDRGDRHQQEQDPLGDCASASEPPARDERLGAGEIAAANDEDDSDDEEKNRRGPDH
jgi:hypothetical protein